jgi:hypothetical protein
LSKGRHFQDEIMVLCVRWYLRFSLTYRDLEELMTERNLSVDHTTVWRWVQRYAPELNKRIRREVEPTNGSCFQAEDDAHVSQGHFTGHASKPGEQSENKRSWMRAPHPTNARDRMKTGAMLASG